MRPVQQLQYFLERSSIPSDLRSRGFQRSGLTWTRVSGGVAHLIDFQRSRFNDPGSVKFTINIGVVLKDLWWVYSGENLSRRIHEADCFPRFRVGEALGGFRDEARDLWWTLIENDGSDGPTAEVRSALFERCLPILDRLNSVDAIYHFVQEEAPPRHLHPFTRIALAILCHLHGDADRAATELDALELNSRLGEEWRTRIRDVRARLITL
jgi:hypothetical protein